MIRMPLLFALFLIPFFELPSAQEPRRVDPTLPTETKPAYRVLKKGEEALEGLLQRVECPYGRPVIYTMRVGKNVERFDAPQLTDVDYIAHTPTFKGPMTCGGRGKGDLVRLTWKKAGTSRRVVAIEFLPVKRQTVGRLDGTRYAPGRNWKPVFHTSTPRFLSVLGGTRGDRGDPVQPVCWPRPIEKQGAPSPAVVVPNWLEGAAR